MNINDLVEKTRIFAHAEITLLKAEARRTRTSMLLMSLSVGCLLIAVILFNFALFFSLTEAKAHSDASFMLCAMNLLIAVVPVLISRQLKPGIEEKMVKDIRNMAADSISAQTKKIGQETQAIQQSFGLLKTGVSGGANSLSTLLPFVSLLAKALKKSK